jgi:hypothetical protein
MGGQRKIALTVRKRAADEAVAHLMTMVGQPSDPSYRKTLVQMLQSGALPHDIVGAVRLGLEIAVDVLEDKIAKEELNVKRID